MANNSKAQSPVSAKVYVTFTALVSEDQYDHENTVRLELEFPNAYMGVVPLAKMAQDTMTQAISDYGQRLADSRTKSREINTSDAQDGDTDEEFTAYANAMIESTATK